MAITSIFIDGEIPVIANMKTLDDFIIKNFFTDLPSMDATPYAGYYFGDRTTDITINSFDTTKPAAIHGALNNSADYISVGGDNYLDTREFAVIALTMGTSFRRPNTPSVNTWFLADFIGTGDSGVGFALGIGANGKLRLVTQVSGQAFSTAEVDIPSSIAIGDVCGVTCFIRSGTSTVAIYDPATDAYVSSAIPVAGTRVAGTNSILVGRKQDNNAAGEGIIDVKAVLLMNGSLSTPQHVALQKYLIAM